MIGQAGAVAVIGGLQTDVVTLALSGYDIVQIAEQPTPLPAQTTGETRLQNNSTPYTSTVCSWSAKGSPKHIKD